MQEILTQPLRIGGVEVAGRLFKAATAETRAEPDGGHVGDDVLDFYEPIARGGTPLIITGNLAITADGAGLYREIAIDADDKLPGLRTLTALVHEHGSKIFAQLNHCGRQVIGHRDPVSASSTRELTYGAKPRPMTVAEIHQATADFAAAAGRAQEAGFDGVQVHFAHGYLLNQFLTPYTNRRTDDYGGTPQKRLRFGVEAVRAVRARVGDGYPIIAKFNGHDMLPGRPGLKTPALVEAAAGLQDAGLDGVEITSGHHESGLPMMRGRFTECFRAMAAGQFRTLPQPRQAIMRALWPVLAGAGNLAWGYREGYHLDYCRQFKARLDIPVICVGGWQHREQIEDAIRGGGCDAVSSARAMIADPLLFRHLVRDGVAAPACSFCNGCMGRLSHLPVDCYDFDVRTRRDAMLAKELGWAPRSAEPITEDRTPPAEAPRSRTRR